MDFSLWNSRNESVNTFDFKLERFSFFMKNQALSVDWSRLMGILIPYTPYALFSNLIRIIIGNTFSILKLRKVQKLNSYHGLHNFNGHYFSEKIEFNSGSKVLMSSPWIIKCIKKHNIIINVNILIQVIKIIYEPEKGKVNAILKHNMFLSRWVLRMLLWWRWMLNYAYAMCYVYKAKR